MAKKSLGYVQLEWTCPRCGAKNPGTQTTCISCGGPQPQDTAFQQGQSQELITGEKAAAIAKQGADIICGFCGTRNPGNAIVCSQCGGDLKEDARRTAGQVLGTRQTGPAGELKCPACGQMNPAGALKCANCGASLAGAGQPIPAAPAAAAAPKKSSLSRWVVIGIVAGIVVVAVFLIAVLGKRTTVAATVTNLAWDTSVQIEFYQPVSHNDWKENVPSDGTIQSCDQRYYRTSDQPAANSTEVCGTPYTVDQGNGYGQEVQDCEYQVYEDYCTYSVTEWTVVDQATSHGEDLNWSNPQPNLTAGQRLGDFNQDFHITFSSDKGDYVYETSNQDLFQQAGIGSHWDLDVNALNAVVSAQPSE